MVFKFHHFLLATMLLSRNQRSVLVLWVALTDARRCFNPPFDAALTDSRRCFTHYSRRIRSTQVVTAH